jgi:ligand-binding SRPBCC domain-containing protein
MLEDKIQYNLPLGSIANIISSIIDNNLNSWFKCRHRITRVYHDTHQKFQNSKITKILISDFNVLKVPL